jgi:hypothetical protein
MNADSHGQEKSVFIREIRVPFSKEQDADDADCADFSFYLRHLR